MDNRKNITNNISKTRDLTTGSTLKGILLFSLPIFLSNILLQLYNLTDIAIIGHALGDDALSAIGSVSTIYGLYNSLLFGMGNGISIVIARHFGSGDMKNLRRGVANTIFLSLFWLVIITVTAKVSLKPIMRALNTPESLMDSAYSYANIVLTFLIFPFIYNILTGLLRAIGNSLAPLFFLSVSVTSNIVLDILFVYVFGWGLRGAASATVIAQSICALVCFIYVVLYVPILHVSREDMKLDFGLIGDLFTQGLSFAMMYTVVNAGTVILQGAINLFGKTTIAAHTTARKISELCMMTLSTLATSMATFAGQNHGAHKYDRIKKGMRQVTIFSWGIATGLVIMIYTIGPFLTRFVSGSSNPELIRTAVFYLRVDLPFYYVLAILLITRSTLQGIGAKIVPLIASVAEMLIKVLTASWLAKAFGYTGIAICEPITWTLCAVYIAIIFLIKIKSLNSANQEAGVV